MLTVILSKTSAHIFDAESTIRHRLTSINAGKNTPTIAIIPTTATALSTIYLNRQRHNDKKEQERRDARSDAKSSIQNMITQDIIRAEVLGKMPENRTDIEDEYTIYHANGGNGKITRQVNEYTLWYEQFRPSKSNPKKIDTSK